MEKVHTAIFVVATINDVNCVCVCVCARVVFESMYDSFLLLI